MIDHTGVSCSQYSKSKEFYTKALAGLRYELLHEFSTEDKKHVAGFGVDGKADFWLKEGTPQKPISHIAFRASDRSAVDAFYKAGMAAGGRDNGQPGVRPRYHDDYYAAFLIDPDGNNIEAVCHDSESVAKDLVQFGP